MKCVNCKHENPEGSRFCEKCGQQIVQTAPAETVPPLPPAAKEPPSQPVKIDLNYFDPEAAASPRDDVFRQMLITLSLWLRERLPVLGGLLVLVGFFLPWIKSGAGHGFFYIIQGISGLDKLSGIKDMTDLATNNLLFIVIVTLGLILVPLAGLVGLTSLLGTPRLRTFGITMATIALVDMYLFFFSFLFGKIGILVETAGPGVWMVTAGLLWMIISPMFAPPRD